MSDSYVKFVATMDIKPFEELLMDYPCKAILPAAAAAESLALPAQPKQEQAASKQANTDSPATDLQRKETEGEEEKLHSELDPEEEPSEPEALDGTDLFEDEMDGVPAAPSPKRARTEETGAVVFTFWMPAMDARYGESEPRALECAAKWSFGVRL